MMYALDINKLIQWLLPAAIRKSLMVAWLNALLAPAKTLHTAFLAFANATRTHIRITGQKRVLEYYLDRNFGPITLIDATASAPVYMYTEAENQPLYLPVFITGSQVDFIAQVPLALAPQEAAIRAFIQKYKLPTRRFEIQYL